MRIPRHLNGPPDSGQGGYVAGSLAVRLPGPGADVWLRAPAPLETDLEQRRAMLQAWADYLDTLRTGAQVIPIRAA